LADAEASWNAAERREKFNFGGYRSCRDPFKCVGKSIDGEEALRKKRRKKAI